MEQKKYDNLLTYLNKGVYHYYVTSKYELVIQEIENKFPDSEFNWLIDSHYEYLLNCYDESINKNENPLNMLNNSRYLEGLAADECKELLQCFKDSLLPVYEKDYKDARKSLIKNCSGFILISIIICLGVYCAIYVCPEDAKTISKFGRLLFWGLLYFGIIVYYKVKTYRYESKIFRHFKQRLEYYKL